MTLEDAPLFNDIAHGPPDGAAYWLRTEDGVQIRAAVWGRDSAKATVLLFPGRTEYIEKYGIIATALANRGYATVVIDWRGQGLADRILDNRDIGHVLSFADYQTDLAAVMALADKLDLPSPRHLLAHSLGGCIGLRALIEGLDVASAVFSAPMWNIALTPARRGFARAISAASYRFGFSENLAPTTSDAPYVLINPFDDNMLTTDPDIYADLGAQLRAQPDLTLGGPSVGWLGLAMRECDRLAPHPCPQTPVLTFLGTNERIVSKPAITDRMARWSNGTLDIITGAEHEVLMEIKPIRDRVIDMTCAHFEQHTPST